MARNRNQQNRPFCNFCRAVGHRAMHCRKRKMYISGQIQNITCRTCQGLGHYSHMCNLLNQRQVPQNWLKMDNVPSTNRNQQFQQQRPQQYQQRRYQPRQQLQIAYPTQPPPIQPPKYNPTLFGTYSTVPQINTNLQPSQITPLSTTNSQLQLTTHLPTQVNVIEQQQQFQQQLQQLQLQTQQIQLQQQQNTQVLQPVAQLQIQNSLPSTESNVTTTLFRDSDIDNDS